MIFQRIKNKINSKLKQNILGKDNIYYRKSFSQCFEDRFCLNIIKTLKLTNPIYLDIGCNHPIEHNNTYLLYQQGFKGVLIEPIPSLCEIIKEKRPNDIVLNIGVGANKEIKKLYEFNANVLSTFCKTDADEIVKDSKGKYFITKEYDVELLNINQIIQEYFTSCPNIISIDVEGLNLEIIKGFDFKAYRPEIFLIETINFTIDFNETKIEEIYKIMKENGYMLFIDTYINSIFVDEKKYRNIKE